MATRKATATTATEATTASTTTTVQETPKKTGKPEVVRVQCFIEFQVDPTTGLPRVNKRPNPSTVAGDVPYNVYTMVEREDEEGNTYKEKLPIMTNCTHAIFNSGFIGSGSRDVYQAKKNGELVFDDKGQPVMTTSYRFVPSDYLKGILTNVWNRANAIVGSGKVTAKGEEVVTELNGVLNDIV